MYRPPPPPAAAVLSDVFSSPRQYRSRPGTSTSSSSRAFSVPSRKAFAFRLVMYTTPQPSRFAASMKSFAPGTSRTWVKSFFS